MAQKLSAVVVGFSLSDEVRCWKMILVGQMLERHELNIPMAMSEKKSSSAPPVVDDLAPGEHGPSVEEPHQQPPGARGGPTATSGEAMAYHRTTLWGSEHFPY